VVLAGPYAVAALLLGVAGIAKVVRPAPARRALINLGLPVPISVIRAGAGAEACLAGAALATGNRVVAAGVAASFLAFTAFVAVAIVRPTTVGDCGCFGGAESPPTFLHLTINAAFTLVAVLASATGVRSLFTEVRLRPGLGVPLVALVSLATWFAYLCLSELAALTALFKSQSVGGSS
jgi:hypothetical protein